MVSADPQQNIIFSLGINESLIEKIVVVPRGPIIFDNGPRV
jgi:hypothetical protein